METAKQLLTDCKTALGVETDYKLAKAMEMHNGLISDYMAGKRVPDTYACLRMAEILNRAPLEVIALVEAARARNAQRREYWNGFLQRVAKRAVTVTLALVFGFISVAALPLCGGGTGGFFRSRRYA